MEDNKIRVTVTDPETRNAITYSFNTMEELITWAQEQVAGEDEVQA